ncbi:DUF262 domain-containing protein [Aeromonas sp. sif2433]|uniref:DUF262 domain-containing protein n=1 Tax=Aeromonas sp. sif2433 TaxID=2854794 RepID=UPI001C47DC55|nr:DUF262 domain-containing protein [Aeromonas sp. sif2433]MBV7413580.1 DUF262 domain-containing HNH endonuclease family protein [Aeromonas sp. sif2433]
MELHAYTRTISDLLSVKRKYIVPRFQRGYSWTKEQVLELWDDILSNIKHNKSGYSNEEYFIGALVLVGNEKSIAYKIVDGQQRLTTLTILLSVLCDQFKTIGRDNLANAIYDNFIAGTDDNGERYFKLENETPKPFFQVNIQHIDKTPLTPSTEEEKTLSTAYNELSMLASIDGLKAKGVLAKSAGTDEHEAFLKALREQVINYLKVIFITVNEEEEAYTIFETLNARGMNLSCVDLIKNKLFNELKDTHPDDAAKTTWASLRSKISSRDGVGSLENYVRHWWISKYSYVSAENLYSKFKLMWNKGGVSAKDFIEELRKDADLYVKISSPQVEDFKQQEERYIYKTLMAFKTFGLSQQRPFLLSLLKAKERKLISNRDVKRALNFLESFHFKFNAICSLRPSGIESSYSRAARDMQLAVTKVDVKKVVAELIGKLKEREPEKALFKDKFSEIKFHREFTKQKKLVQYILSRFEGSFTGSVELTPEDITIEHILPQEVGKSDPALLDVIGTVGNLIPLGAELNKEAGNKTVDLKIDIYRKSDFKMTSDFVKRYKSPWDPKSIKDNNLRLADIAYEKIWRIEA